MSAPGLRFGSVCLGSLCLSSVCFGSVCLGSLRLRAAASQPPRRPDVR